jgi:GDPmannose 4,6-dehydratase
LILQQDNPEDFVIATGVTMHVREFVRMAFSEVGLTVELEGKGVDEKGYVIKCSNIKFQLAEGTEVIAVDPKYFRPTEVELLIGDPTKSMTKLGWKPRYDLKGLVSEMVAADIGFLKKENCLKSQALK